MREAVARSAPFDRLVVLAAEVDLSSRPPAIARIPLDPSLRGRRIGVALRIGRFRGWGGGTGRFADDPETVRGLAELTRSLAAEARARGVPLAEIQLDYDCPESALADYPVLIDAVRAAVAPVPVTVTALPSWLRQERAFRKVAEAAGGYVLQVHALTAPARPGDPAVLCDPVAAARAAEDAGRFGRPFRVALPTYGYGAVFDARGQLLGVAAEGWSGPPGQEVRSDPAAMAELVRRWSRDRPAAMTGLLWYRLPVAGDARNWPWPTLRAVMAGRPPRHGLLATVRTPESGLAEIDLNATGEAAEIPPPGIQVRWSAGTLLAADGLAGYRVRIEPGGARLRSGSRGRSLAPGERRTVAWLRFEAPTEIHVEIVH